MNNVTAGFQVLPNGQDVDTNGMIPRIVDVVKESGLRYHVGPMETVVEGNIDEVFSLLKRTQELGVELGASEVLTNIKIHYNPDGVSIEDKMTHVN